MILFPPLRALLLGVAPLFLLLVACERSAPPVAQDAGSQAPPSAMSAQQERPADPVASPPGEEVLLTVGPELVPCTGVAPQTCLRVRTKIGGDWELFYDRIEGFDHEPGFETSIIARRERMSNPPADASAYRWVLVQVIGRRPLVVPP